ncbi:MAG: hypothetical protein J7K23_01025 [Thermoproteales archaeon]|nr:hypothetical protein [Thermoproteales archaeon]
MRKLDEYSVFLSRFLTNDEINGFSRWLVKRGLCEKTIRERLRYIMRPLNLSLSHSVKAHRLFLHYLNERYGVNVDRFLSWMKIPRSGVDLNVPTEKDISRALSNVRKYPRLFEYMLLLLSSGLRLIEIVYFLRNYSVSNLVYNDDIKVYRLQFIRGSKKAFYLFVPSFIMDKIDIMRLGNLSESYYITMSRKANGIGAKYIRKFVATKMYSLGISSETIDFIQGRTPRSILAQHYLNLLPVAIKNYRKYASWLREFLGDILES